MQTIHAMLLRIGLTAVVMMGAACSSAPDAPEVHVTVAFETALAGDATLGVQLQPVSAGAALPVFMADRDVVAGTRETTVVLPYGEVADDVAEAQYRISARADGDDVFLLGRSDKALRLDADGARAGVTLRAP